MLEIFTFLQKSVSPERKTQHAVITSAVVGMFFPYRHVGIILSRRRHGCRHNLSFKIE